MAKLRKNPGRCEDVLWGLTTGHRNCQKRLSTRPGEQSWTFRATVAGRKGSSVLPNPWWALCDYLDGFMDNTQDVSSFCMIKCATILEVTQCPKIQDAFNTISLLSAPPPPQVCLALLDSSQGWLEKVGLFGCMELFRLGKALGNCTGTNESLILLPVQQVFK